MTYSAFSNEPVYVNPPCNLRCLSKTPCATHALSGLTVHEKGYCIRTVSSCPEALLTSQLSSSACWPPRRRAARPQTASLRAVELLHLRIRTPTTSVRIQGNEIHKATNIASRCHVAKHDLSV